MTVETFTPSPSYTVSGTGPYTITHPYRAGADIVVTVVFGGTAVTLGSGDYTVDPDGSDDQGTVTLSESAAAYHAGQTLYLSRATPVEQGWEGQTVREAGMEAQLDQLAMAIQDTGAMSGRAAFQLQVGETGLIADADTRALHFTAFDVTGTPMLIALADIQTAFAPDVVPRHFDTVAEMLNSLEVGGGAGTIWRAAHTMWEEADAGEPSPHRTTAGGVKLFEAGVQFSTIDRFKAAVARGWVWQTNDVVRAGSEAFIFLDDGNTDLSGLPGWAYTVIDGGIF